MSESPKPLILLVEDDATIRRLARIGIERSGFAVDDAPDGRTAIALIDDAARPYVGAVIDLGLPDMNGADVVAHARRTRPNTVVVVCSGSVVSGYEPPIVIVQKPYTPLGLGAAVKDAVKA